MINTDQESLLAEHMEGIAMLFKRNRFDVNEGFKAPTSDKELMESTAKRLKMIGATDMPVGTTIKSIPGVEVMFIPIGSMSVPTVFEAGTKRPIGSIHPTGQIIYVQPR